MKTTLSFWWLFLFPKSILPKRRSVFIKKPLKSRLFSNNFSAKVEWIILNTMKKDIFVDNKTTAFYHEAMLDRRKIVNKFLQTEHIVVYPGDCLELLKSIPDESIKLVVTSPPYNLGKE